ncbi:Zn-ribbon domain-containing OB-fold protein [Rhodococcus sp. NPDC003322]
MTEQTEQRKAGAPPGVWVGRCAACGEIAVPRPEFCPRCLGDDVVEERHDGAGVVYAATAVRRGPKGVALPFGLAYVDLSETLRVMARYELCDAPLLPQTRVVVTQTGATRTVPVLTASVVAEEGAVA